MKKHLSALLLGWLILAACLSSVRADDSIDLRNMVWGTEVKKFSHLTLIKDEGDLKYYKLKNIRKVGGIRVEYVGIMLYKNRPGNLFAFFNDANTFERLKNYLDQIYKPKNRIHSLPFKCIWDVESPPLIVWLRYFGGDEKLKWKGLLSIEYLLISVEIERAKMK